MKTAFITRFIVQACLVAWLLSVSASCSKKHLDPAKSIAQPEDHFLGAWKLSKDKTRPPPPFRTKPADELITITREGEAYVLTFIPSAGRSYEEDGVVIGDTKQLGVGVGLVNGKLQAHRAHVERKDSDTLIEGSEFSRIEYTVLPDQRTLRVKLQTVNVDNAYQWELIYNRTSMGDGISGVPW
jgi:hypothetical protein